MRRASSRWLSLGMRWGLAALLLVGIAGAATMNRWLPDVQKRAGAWFGASEAGSHSEHEAETAAAHAHEGEAPGAHADEPKAGAAAADEHAHETADAIVLSAAAQKNIGLRLAKVELKSFERTMSVPGMVVERPGWSVLEVTAPMTGVVTRIYPIQGEAVRPGQPLFEVRLTHEDLLQVQTEFLRTVEEIDVVRREVERLEKVTVDGAIAGKTLLERKYEQQKDEATLRSQRQALLLHGLSRQQVDDIVSTRTLLQSLTVRAPGVEGTADASATLLQVQQLKAAQGKHVAAGETLCTLVDYHELYIEGMAFEQDIQPINRAAAAGQHVSAIVGSKSAGDDENVEGLHILYLDDQVERESRAFHFYVTLPNRVLRQDKTPDGRGFVYWQFKPGQRIRILIPVERWTDRIVLPVEAVAQDGAEAYVFAFDGDDFQRKPVHVEYRDQDSVVIANDGTLELGTTVAVSGAHQIQLAMKNKSGGGVDPHAGHNH